MLQKQDKKLHKLKYYRALAGLKQSDFGTLLGCTEQNYSLKESGHTELKRKEMLLIQSALNKKMKAMGEESLSLDEIFLP
ncbi:hypothetical protein C8E03_11956 [Lachnotalea glycerini]|uniref:HTH cro/C1-type domain-containing protein n=1 Tax=Lachnotalea glycerini TaxID=1763509 RepID=A0A318EM80_9FIRM|nr:helix-turn-helix transcriptional regulator [Lachnotalea glycerini]PXV85132.1 hypothetical protein C8E03_11956 [Lachnotalea glycerini]